MAGWIRPSATSFDSVKPGDLAADRVETGEHHSFGGVVDDEIDAGEVLQGADVAALTADDPTLHVVGGQRHDGNGGLGHVAGGRALYAHRQDVLGPAVALVPGLLFDGPHHLGHVVPDLVLGALENDLRRLVPRQPGDLLQLALLLVPCRLRFFDHLAIVRLAIGDGLLPPGKILLQLVQGFFPLEQTALELYSLLAPLLGLGLDLRAQLMEFVLELHPRFSLQGLSLALRVLDDLPGGLLGRSYLRLAHVLAGKKASDGAHYRHHQHYHDPYHSHISTIPLARVTAACSGQVCEDRVIGENEKWPSIRSAEDSLSLPCPNKGQPVPGRRPRPSRQPPHGYIPHSLSLRLSHSFARYADLQCHL